jgi:hypothetical protein
MERDPIESVAQLKDPQTYAIIGADRDFLKRSIDKRCASSSRRG